MHAPGFTTMQFLWNCKSLVISCETTIVFPSQKTLLVVKQLLLFITKTFIIIIYSGVFLRATPPRVLVATSREAARCDKPDKLSGAIS